MRDPEVLAEQMDPQAHCTWRRLRRAELPGGAVRDSELGPVRLRRSEHGRVFATVTTPTQPGRWGALTFVLDIQQGRVAIRQIQRLHARGDYGRTTARDTPPREVPLEERSRTRRCLPTPRWPAQRQQSAPRGHQDPRQLAARHHRPQPGTDRPTSPPTNTHRARPAPPNAVNPSVCLLDESRLGVRARTASGFHQNHLACCLTPSSQFEATRWIRKEVHSAGCRRLSAPPATGRWTGCSNTSRPCSAADGVLRGREPAPAR
jgi:hypothetical protein